MEQLLTNTVAPTDDLVTILTDHGERIPNPEYDPWVADIGVAELQALYTDMVVIRRMDTEATALQRQGELGTWAPLLGQEAAQIGSARALRPDDFVFSSYRENGVAYVKGATPEELMRMCRGTTNTGWDPYALNMAPMQIIIGAQALHATGYAMATKHDGGDQVAITYFGDGATSQGNVNEAMIFAASYDAPVIFFCQNNQYAISEPVRLQSKRRLVDRAAGIGILPIRVDGNDVLAATRIALDQARTGQGPSFIEAVTYRMGPHTTSDDPTRYRPPAELEVWRFRDPIKRLETLLGTLHGFDEDFRRSVTEFAEKFATNLRAACLGLKAPDPETLFDNVYAEPNRSLARQRDEFDLYRAMFDTEAEQ